MKTLNLRTTIGPDGTIDLHVASDLPPGEADFVLVVQPVASAFPGPPFPSYACRGERPLPTGMGKYRSGRRDTSANVDEFWPTLSKRGYGPDLRCQWRLSLGLYRARPLPLENRP
jgi:hypothetical protein